MWLETKEWFLAAISQLLHVRGIAFLLHINRPLLVPIPGCVCRPRVGLPKPQGRKWVQVDWAIETMHDNAAVIAAVTRHLAAEQGLVRSPVRVLDALLWSAIPGSPFYAAMRITKR